MTRKRQGKIYYVYADPNGCNCAYVGSPQAWQTYQNGGSGNNSYPSADGGSQSTQTQIENAIDDDDSTAQPGTLSLGNYLNDDNF